MNRKAAVALAALAFACGSQGDGAITAHGWVKPGSIVKVIVDQRVSTTFVVEHDGVEQRVHIVGPVSDGLQGGSAFLVTGTLSKDGVLEATDARGGPCLPPEIYEHAKERPPEWCVFHEERR